MNLNPWSPVGVAVLEDLWNLRNMGTSWQKEGTGKGVLKVVYGSGDTFLI